MLFWGLKVGLTGDPFSSPSALPLPSLSSGFSSLTDGDGGLAASLAGGLQRGDISVMLPKMMRETGSHEPLGMPAHINICFWGHFKQTNKKQTTQKTKELTLFL